MSGEGSDQRGLWEADQLYLDLVGRDTFYGLLASLRGQLFQDADFDIGWKVALGIEIEDRPFAKSTLPVFRAQLILHDKVRELFEPSLGLAGEVGYLKGKRGMRVSPDTTYIPGRGAVQDTDNLLSDGIVKLMRALAAVGDVPVRRWAETHGYRRYVGSSVKGATALDWSNRRARRRLLAQIIADADRLLELARQTQDGLDADRPGDDAEADGGVSLKDGVSKDRTVSVHDPEKRHSHKSSRRRFDGHQAAVVVDSGQRQPVDHRSGRAAWQGLGQHGRVGLGGTERGSAGVPVVEAIGDTAYGDGDTRSARPTQQQAFPQG